MNAERSTKLFRHWRCLSTLQQIALIIAVGVLLIVVLLALTPASTTQGNPETQVKPPTSEHINKQQSNKTKPSPPKTPPTHQPVASQPKPQPTAVPVPVSTQPGQSPQIPIEAPVSEQQPEQPLPTPIEALTNDQQSPSSTPIQAETPTNNQQPPRPPETPSETPPDTNNYLKIAGVRLLIASENTTRYNRSQYGEHRSNICSSATSDPYTGLEISKCDVDHVVALAEAHQSGAWQWDNHRKRNFAQDGDNHLATLACVNRSKGARDIADWSDSWIAKSKACGGSGYSVSTQGRCLFARITVRVKAKYNLSVDRAEAQALRNLSGCFSE